MKTDSQTVNVKNSRHKELVILALITFILFALKAIWVVLISFGPTNPDELVYKFNTNTIFTLQKYYSAHFPPAYSLMLAPALFFKHWYEGMLIINAFLSSLVVPVTWLLARTVGVRKPLIAALLAGLLPMHAIYPHLLLSENLFVPLFVMAVALALRGGRRGPIEVLAFGFVLGIAHLTKYLFLPAIPILFGMWLYIRIKKNQEHPTRAFSEQFYPALLVLLAYGLVIGGWLCYGLASDFSLKQLFGFNITGVIGKASTGSSFLMWLGAYSCYVILAWLPVWVLIAIWISQLNDKSWWIDLKSEYSHFLMLVLLLFGCYWFVAVHHSFAASYNYPVPRRLIGRYLMQLSPIMFVVGMWVLDRLIERRILFRKTKALIGVGIWMGLSFLAWGILFNKGAWKSSVTFPISESGGVDVIALVSTPIFLSAIVMGLLLMAMLFIKKIHAHFLILPIVVLMFVFLLVDAGRMQDRQDGHHARELAFAAANFNGKEKDVLNIIFDDINLPIPFIQKSLFFWEVKQRQVAIQNVSTQLGYNFAAVISPTFLLASVRLNIQPLREYRVNDKRYYIYRIDGVDPKIVWPGNFNSNKNSK